MIIKINFTEKFLDIMNASYNPKLKKIKRDGIPCKNMNLEECMKRLKTLIDYDNLIINKLF